MYAIEEFFKEYDNRPRNSSKESELSKIDFYEEVQFEFLSDNQFKEFIDQFESNEMTGTLWNKLKGCFYVYRNSSEEEELKYHHRYIQKGRMIEYDNQKDHAFHGIIHELRKETGGNVDDTGCVKVTSLTTLDSSHSPKKLSISMTAPVTFIPNIKKSVGFSTTSRNEKFVRPTTRSDQGPKMAKMVIIQRAG